MNGLRTVAVLAVVSLCANAAWAEAARRGERGANRPDREAMKAEFREAFEEFASAQHERAKKHYEKQMEENRDLWKSVKTDTPAAIVALLKEHRQTQFNENKSFAAAQQSRREEFVKSFEKLPPEASAKLLEKIEARYQEATAHFTTQHNENLAFLDKLATQSDLTIESLKAALKEHYEQQRAENKKFFEQFKKRGK